MIRLSLHHNDFEGDPFTVLSSLTSLKVLNLQRNHFSGPLSTLELPLPLLRTINLAENKYVVVAFAVLAVVFSLFCSFITFLVVDCIANSQILLWNRFCLELRAVS